LAETLALQPRPRTLWLQLGLWDEQVARDGTAAGLQVVMDRCLKVDHARLF
jgi:predicted CoA-binding protein